MCTRGYNQSKICVLCAGTWFSRVMMARSSWRRRFSRSATSRPRPDSTSSSPVASSCLRRLAISRSFPSRLVAFRLCNRISTNEMRRGTLHRPTKRVSPSPTVPTSGPLSHWVFSVLGWALSTHQLHEQHSHHCGLRGAKRGVEMDRRQDLFRLNSNKIKETHSRDAARHMTLTHGNHCCHMHC